MLKRSGLAITAIALIAISIWIIQSEHRQPENTAQSPEGLSNLQWRKDSQQRYTVRTESHMTMSSGAQQNTEVHVLLDAELVMLTLASESQSAMVGMQLTSANLRINDLSDPASNAALSEPFRVRISSTGIPLDFEFPHQIDKQNRRILENLIRTFQVSVKNDDSWVATESNGSGDYKAHYQRRGTDRLLKSKTAFLPAEPGKVAWSQASSNEHILLNPTNDWLTEMTIEEEMISSGNTGPEIQVTTQASLQLSAYSGSINKARWEFDTSTAAKPIKREINALSSEQSLAEKEASLRASITELDELSRGRLAVIYRLSDLIQSHSGVPQIVLDILREDEVSDRTRADLYLALEKAGTANAQAALVSVFDDESWSLVDGMRAIVAMGGIRQANNDSIAALWEASSYYEGGERQRMANAAKFALGSIGQHLNSAGDSRYAALRSELLSKAQGLGDPQQRSNFITALGNTKDETLAEPVSHLLSEEEPTVRRAAALALGTLGTDQFAPLMVQHYRSDDNHYVRAALATSLTQWSQPDESAMAMFRERVRSEHNEGTRFQLAAILGKHLQTFPENKAVLQEIMRHEPSKRIRQKVAESLATQ